MHLNEFKDTLWSDWLEALREAQKSPYEETVDVEVTSSRRDDTLDRILNGEWDEVRMEMEDSNLDWRSDQDDTARKAAWDDVLRKHKSSLNGLDWGDDDQDDSLSELFEEFESRLEEEESDLVYGYTELDFRITGHADIQISVEYNGVSSGSSWFEEETDDEDQTLRFFEPKKDFIGFLTLLNMSKDDFSAQLMQGDWLDAAQKERFSEALASAHQAYTQEFGLPLLDASTPSSVTPKRLVDWVQTLFESKEEILQSGLCTTVSLSGPELTELADSLAIAKGNASGPLETQHMMKAWVGAGAKLYDAEGNVSEPLELDAPLLLPIEDQLKNEQYDEGEKAGLTFPVIESWMAERKIQEWMRKEVEEGVDYSERLKHELRGLDFTPEMRAKKSSDFLDRIQRLGVEMREFDERDLRFPPNPAVLKHFASVEGKSWKTKDGTPIAHALWSSFPTSTVCEFIDTHRINLLDKDMEGNTIVHRAAFAMAGKMYHGDLSDALGRWLNQSTIKIQNNEGVTPLDILVRSKHKELPESLLEALDGAGVNWIEPNVARKGETLAQRFGLESHSFVQRQQLQKRVAGTLNDRPKDAFAL